MKRKDQAKRKKDIYIRYKSLVKSNSNEERTKESIYCEIMNEFSYSSVNSVKAIVREMKTLEAEQNKEKIKYYNGVIDSLLIVNESMVLEKICNNINFTYSIKFSQEVEETILIELSYNSGKSRKESFDHFSSTNTKEAVARLHNLIQECYESC